MSRSEPIGRESKAPGHIPSLDGLRAIAISAVIAIHIGERLDWPHPGSFAHGILMGTRYGYFWIDGVGIFFVLSGFLITTLLLREYDKTGTISLRAFYIRRAFRILPPLYVYLLFALVFCWWNHIQKSAQDFLSPAFFYRDYYLASNLWLTQHTWSLSVEEQFYLLWPLLLLFTLRYKGRTTTAWVAFFLILLTPLLRVAGKLSHLAYLQHHSITMFHTRMDSLMCGCLAALLIGNTRFESIYIRLAKVWWTFPLHVLVISRVLSITLGVSYDLSVGLTIDSACIAFFIVWASRNPNSAVGKVLNSKLFATAGVLSYSAYLWQTFFIHPENHTWVTTMPWNLLWIWVAAWASYTLVEQPALRLRNRLFRPQIARSSVTR